MDARQVREIYENLRGLLEAGQPPALRVLLRARFLEACLAGGERVWSAYGYEVSRELADEAGRADVRSLPPRERAALRDVFDRCLARPVPPYGDGDAWRRELGIARARWNGEKDGGEGATSDPPAGGSVFVPGVARIRGNDSAHPFFRDLVVGSLVPLQVRADGLFRAHPGGMRMSGPPRGGPDDESLRNVPREAAALRPWSALPTKRVRFEVDMNGAPAYLDGRSCELALTIAAAAAWSELAPFARVKHLKPGVAMTGVVSDGRVLPVAEKTLGAKVEACFFGPVRILYVPDAQREEASTLARSLAADSAGRSLEVRGASRIEDVWNDRDVISASRRPRRFLPVILRRLALSRLFVGGLILAILISGGLAIHEWSTTRPFPAAAAWNGNEILVANEHGHQILVIDESGWFAPGDVDAVTRDGLGSRLAVRDLDGDGVREILTIYDTSPVKAEGFAAIDGGGRILWNHEADTYGFREPVADLHWLAFYPMVKSATGSAAIPVLRRMVTGSLSVVEVYDAATGERQGMFGNLGHAEGVFLIDFDHDGEMELCVPATHNPTRSGILALMQPTEMNAGAGVIPLEELRLWDDPAALNEGLLAAFLFPIDAYSVTRAHALLCSMRGDDLEVEVAGSGPGDLGNRAVMYFLRLPDPAHPVLDRILLNDSYRALIHRDFPDLTDDDIAAEVERLARETKYLTADGWKPIPLGGP